MNRMTLVYVSRKHAFGPILFGLVLLFSFYNVTSQEVPPILQAKSFQKGIYKDFNEFLTNAPSIKIDFDLLVRSKRTDLIIKDSAINKKTIQKFWGVSTGDSIYVNVSNYQSGSGFTHLQKLGRYCYFKGWASIDTPGRTIIGVAGGGVGAALASIPIRAAFILNINNGYFFMLDKDIMELILKKDLELLNSFNSEKKKRDPDILLSYIEKYNLRHEDEIGKKDKMTRVILYRRAQKEKSDSLIVFSDSVQYVIAPNSFMNINVLDKSINLCLGGDCKIYTLNPDELNYFECSFKTKDSKPIIAPKEKKIGEFYLREIQYYLGKEKTN